MPGSSIHGKGWTDKAIKAINNINPITRILDIGVGCGTYSLRLRGTYKSAEWVAVEAWAPYITEFDLANRYDKVINQDARTVDYKSLGQFDVAFMGDVLEHMTKDEALVLLNTILDVSKYVIISIPIVHYPQDEINGNPFEKHIKDDWSHEECMASFPFVAGYKRHNEIGVYLLSKQEYDNGVLVSGQASRLKVAVYNISKNEEKFAERWAKSAEDADYRLVADTGSTDKTKEILEANGVVVQDIRIKPWRFDRAREASLALIPDDIDVCIALDLDEVLVPGWRAALEEAWTETSTRLRYPYTWSWNTDGSPGTVYYGDKIHARFAYKWVNAVHEVMTPVHGITEQQTWCENFQIHHHPDLSKSRGQYLPLLEISVKEDLNNDRNAHYYGRELMYVGRYKESITELKRHLALQSATWDAERAASMRYIGRCYNYLGNKTEAEKWFLASASEAPGWREPWLDLAQMQLDNKDWSGCYWAVTRALAITDKPKSFITDNTCWGDWPYDLGSTAAWYMGLKDMAIKFAEKVLEINPKNQRVKDNLELMKDMK